MQELIPMLWCDMHYSEKKEKVEGVNYQHMVDGTLMEIELCRECAGQITFTDIDIVYEEYGRKAPPQRKNKSNAKPSGSNSPWSKPLPRGEFPCRFCEYVGSTPQGKGMHEAKVHPKEFEEAGGPVKGRERRQD